MASKRMDMGLVMVLVAMIWTGAKAQSGCTRVIISMSPCLNYVTGNSPTPSQACCSQLENVVQSQPRCLCSVLNGGGTSIGITINQTLALALPGACNVQTPPVSQCNAVDGPAISPATSPVESPTNSPNEEPDSPIAPFMDEIPGGNGSKTVPTTGNNTSNGNVVINLFPLTVFLIFIASSASILSIF